MYYGRLGVDVENFRFWNIGCGLGVDVEKILRCGKTGYPGCGKNSTLWKLGV